MKFVLSGLFALVVAAGVSAGERVEPDTGFEASAVGQSPKGWRLVLRPGVDAVVAVSDEAAASGKQSLKIVNRTPRAPNVFAALTGRFPLEAGKPYRITVKAKGAGGRGVVVAFGPKWRPRMPLEGLGAEWKEYGFEFTPPADEVDAGGYPITILSENLAEAVYLDDLVLAPAPPRDVAVEDGALLPDGSFEAAAVDALPPGWRMEIRGGARVTMAVSEREAIDGGKSLLITNATPRQSNVYGVLSRSLALRPGVGYRISLQARGENANGVFLALGVKWNKRFSLGALNPVWKSFSFRYTPAPEEFSADGKLPFRIVSEGIADAAYLDDLRIEPVGGEALALDALGTRPVRVVPDAAGKRHALFELPAGKHRHTGGPFPDPADFRAVIGLARDGAALRFFADVTDRERNLVTDDSPWNGDSVQFRFSPGLFRDAVDNDVEWLFSAPDKQGRVHAYDCVARAPLPPEHFQANATQTPDGYRLEGRLDGALFRGFDFDAGMTFNVVVNNLRDNGRREIIFLAPGIHRMKRAEENTRLLFAGPKPRLFPVTDSRRPVRRLDGLVYALGFDEAQPWRLDATLASPDGTTRKEVLENLTPTTPEQLLTVRFSFDLGAMPEGDFTLDFRAPDGVDARLSASKFDLKTRQLAALDAVERRVAAVDREVAKLAAPSRYLTVHGEVLRLKAREHRAVLEREQSPEAMTYYARLGEWVVPELEAALARYERLYERRERLPATYAYRAGPAEGARHGIPLHQTLDEAGNGAARPVFFAGYGHFSPVVEDLPLFERLGHNFIQIEIGPRDVFPAPGREGDFSRPSRAYFEKYVEPAMRRALEHNARICLLLSPHYRPGWWLEKYPEVKSDSGFLKYEITHPRSKEMIAAYLDAFIPMLKASPYAAALHSLCLSNEPVYTGARLDKPYTRGHFIEWVERKYGGLAGFNRTAGTDFADADALLAAGLAAPAVNYAFHAYKRETLADWHAELAAGVRKHWPDMPVSAKIMVFKTLEPAYNHEAVDPELFADFSDFNGNDNYMYYKTGRWISDWYTMSMYHDLQRSMRAMPVLNTENHLIKDGDLQDIPYDHIYTATFQQLLQGVAGLATWVWREVPYENALRRPDLPGNMYQRPAAILAQAMAGLDGGRLADEIVRFSNAPATVGIVYAPSSYIQNPAGYTHHLKQVYPALAFTGHKIGFRSERQLAAGDFGGYRLLVLPDATHLTPDAARGLARFAAGGGKVVAVGRAPGMDSHGRALAEAPPCETLDSQLPLAALSARLGRLADGVEALPLRLEREGEANTDIVFRMVPDGGAWLINLVNYKNAAQTIRLTGAEGSLTDLVSGEAAPFERSLPPLTPLFLRFVPAQR